MNRPLAACLLAAVSALAATSLREPVSGFAGFQALPVAPVASHSAVASWASEGRVALLGGTGAMYGLAVTAPVDTIQLHITARTNSVSMPAAPWAE